MILSLRVVAVLDGWRLSGLGEHGCYVNWVLWLPASSLPHDSNEEGSNVGHNGDRTIEEPFIWFVEGKSDLFS